MKKTPRTTDAFARRLADGPALVIAEIAQAHDGSLGTAHAYIDAVAAAGADAVKFQTHIADAESTPGEPWRVKFSPQDETRYAYWKRMEFTEPQWRGLAEHAAEQGLFFLSSPFSNEAVDLLLRVGVPAWKVASGEINNLPFIRYLAATGKPVLLSSGMSSWEDLDAAVDVVRAEGAPLGVFQCTTSYPCPPDKIGLNVLEALHGRYACPVGLSDHSGTIFPGLAAITLGARMVEVHVVFSRACYGPDVSSSVTLAEFEQLVTGVRFIEQAQANPIDKDAMADQLGDLRRTFGKSLVARHALPAGHAVTEQDLTLKKPGTGIPAARMEEYIGRRVTHTIPENSLLNEQDFE